MNPIAVLLVLLAIACFCLDAFEIKAPGKINLTATGLALWALSTLVQILWQTK